MSRVFTSAADRKTESQIREIPVSVWMAVSALCSVPHLLQKGAKVVCRLDSV